MVTYSFGEASFEVQLLIMQAIKAREKAHVPYTGYRVGAAIMDFSGNIYTGCNIEYSGLTLTSHAEMVALDTMVSMGVRTFKCLVSVSLRDDNIPHPCMLCCEKISNFADVEGTNLILGVDLNEDDLPTQIYQFRLSDLIPYYYGRKTDAKKEIAQEEIKKRKKISKK